ncbi:MAG: hypothetical protein Aureis2KO_24540 [Aureisphaera sp.]
MENTKKLIKLTVGKETANPIKKSISPKPNASFKRFFFKTQRAQINKTESNVPMINKLIPKAYRYEVLSEFK